jgi:hypothetical protein
LGAPASRAKGPPEPAWRAGCVVVEIAFLDGDDVVGLELVFFLLVIIEVNGAPFGTDAIQRLRRFEDVVRLGIPLDDRHLVILIVSIGDRHRVGCGAAR